ncbi:hypothetical protein P9477_17760 [Enterobacter mori]|uniref:HNH endonuclease n=1 Tax=Enterobacter mori TaxID=539813 RepID=UPI00398B037B
MGVLIVGKRKKLKPLEAPRYVAVTGAITASQMAEYEAKRKEAKANHIAKDMAKKEVERVRRERKEAQKELIQNQNKEISDEVLAIIGLRRDETGRIVRIKKPTKKSHTQAAIAERALSIPKPGVYNFSKTGNFKYTAEELRALAAGKPLPTRSPVEMPVITPVAAPVEIETQSPVVTPAPLVKPVAPVVEATNATSEPAFFSKEVYQIAIRSMSNGEAWKLAHNENDAQAFLTAHRANYALLDRAVPAYMVEAPVEPPVKPERVLEPVSIPVRGEKVEISTIARDPAAQAAFRKAVTRNYNHCCAITGDTIAIEAAHIQTHSDHYDNSLDNSILLSVGLHRLFDAGIMVIDAELMTIHFKQDCFYKKHLEGAPVRQGKVAINKEKLKAKNLC